MPKDELPIRSSEETLTRMLRNPEYAEGAREIDMPSMLVWRENGKTKEDDI